MSGLLELAARCEEAAGPEGALDLAISDATGAWKSQPTWRQFSPTASLDAAMTLVPEGCAWGITTHPNGTAISYVSGKNRGEGATPALALCAAALRARTSEQGK